MRDRPYRVVQWATGAMGRSMLRAVAARPDLELAGVYVLDPAKIGKDAGPLCGLPDLGITATGSVEEILDLAADCVLYAPLSLAVLGGRMYDDLDTICALLGSGKNVISVTGLVYPYAQGPAVVGELEKACAAGGTSAHGTGIHPGFLCELFPLTLAGLCREVSHVYAAECADLAGHPSRRFVRDLSGLGQPEEDYRQWLPAARAGMRALFGESLHLLAAGLGAELDHVDLDGACLLAAEDFEIAAGPIPRGSMAGHRWSFNGLAGGRPLITLECAYVADTRRCGDWATPGYSVRIDGRPSVALRAPDDWVSNGLTAAAARAVNAIPAVCDALPGIRTVLDLPLISGRARPR